MSQPGGRPPALFPLFAAIDTLPGIGPKGRAGLEQMGIERPRDLILTLPHSGVTRRWLRWPKCWGNQPMK